MIDRGVAERAFKENVAGSIENLNGTVKSMVKGVAGVRSEGEMTSLPEYEKHRHAIEPASGNYHKHKLFNGAVGVTISRWYIASVLTVFAIVICWLFLDKSIIIFLSADNRHYVNFVSLVTKFGDSKWYLVGALLSYIVFRKLRPAVARDALFVFSTTAFSGIVINIVKVLFGRARPELYQTEDLFGFFWFKLGHGYASFPSGHATTAIAVWLAFALLFPKFRWLLIAIGILISMSRVILTQHYPSDVIFGGYIGAVSTLILHQLFYKERKEVYAK